MSAASASSIGGVRRDGDGASATGRARVGSSRITSRLGRVAIGLGRVAVGQPREPDQRLDAVAVGCLRGCTHAPLGLQDRSSMVRRRICRADAGGRRGEPDRSRARSPGGDASGLPGDEFPRCLPSLSRECRNQADGAVSRLLGRPRGTGRSGTGRGFQPAMVRAQARACAVSVTAGNSRRSSTAAENSPRCS